MPPRPSAPFLVSADVILCGSGVELTDGAVLVTEGRISAVGKRKTLLSSTRTEVHLRRHILTPGLVNAHTHLALSALCLKDVEPSFTDWISTMAREVPARSAKSLEQGLAAGIQLALATGTTTVGDIVPLALLPVSRRSPLAGVRFAEVLGLNRDFPTPPPELHPDEGLSPHAPYSTSPEIYRACARNNRQNGTRLALHVAESQDEDEFLRALPHLRLAFSHHTPRETDDAGRLVAGHPAQLSGYDLSMVCNASSGTTASSTVNGSNFANGCCRTEHSSRSHIAHHDRSHGSVWKSIAALPGSSRSSSVASASAVSWARCTLQNSGTTRWALM